MKIQLISHASVVVSCSDAVIWTDPWLEGKVFNDSWSLYPEPAYDAAVTRDVDYLWISHEHPDHLNIPTLRGLPAEFKERVTVLFQKNNSTKVFEALEKFGFRNFRALPHREVVKLMPETEVYCYQVGQMDSCLAIRNRGQIAVNVNDATVGASDSQFIRQDIGEATVVLNQFSTAGYGGNVDHDELLRGMAREHLDLVVENHRDLGAKATIPFASFMVYCCQDNQYMNAFANRPSDLAARFELEGLDLALLYPGDTYDPEEPFDDSSARVRYEDEYKKLDAFEYDKPAEVGLEEIEAAFGSLCEGLHERYPGFVLGRLAPVTVRIPDLDVTVRFAIRSRSFEVIDQRESDLVVFGQPLLFSFRFPFGVQTLGVSSRVVVHSGESNWGRHRMLLSMYNAELYLRPKYLFSATTLQFVWTRRHGLIRQVLKRISQMKRGF